jgi:hypothetical protein
MQVVKMAIYTDADNDCDIQDNLQRFFYLPNTTGQTVEETSTTACFYRTPVMTEETCRLFLFFISLSEIQLCFLRCRYTVG